MLGGGMRQIGIIAVAGLLALDSMIERLKDDHKHAEIIAKGNLIRSNFGKSTYS